MNTIIEYLQNNMDSFLLAIGEHIMISVLALSIAMIMGILAGFLCVYFEGSRKWITGIFNILRIIPSLAILLLLIPILGTGTKPALVALVLLAIPPILLNTLTGLTEVPVFMLETASACGMDHWQVWFRVRFPLAMPMIFAGIKTALTEIIASATLAAKIGAGGLGGIIFTGLGLNRFDLLFIGGITVAILSLSAGLLLDLLEKKIIPYKHIRTKGGNTLKKMKVLGSALLLLILLTLSACSNKEDGIRVGSKDFTENLVVAEIYALALEDAGFTVERKLNIAGSIVHTSIVNDEIDLYPEYTGTGLLSILQMDLLTDPDEVYNLVKEEYDKRFELTWLDSSKANDAQGLVIRREIAEELGIVTISDLQAQAGKIRFASQGEFDQRDDGIVGLEKIYGPFQFLSSKVYDNGLKYQVLQNDEADAAPAYTTEGQLVNTDLFTLLIDDKQMWPPYYLSPVIRNEVLTENPEISEILNRVSNALDTETMTSLNAKVDVEKQEYEEVAQEFWQLLKNE